jgi:Abhydrolase family
MAATGKPSFAPSLYHRYVMDHTELKLAYDGGDVAAWQKKLRRKLREQVGHHRGERVPLRVRSQWRREHELGTIERIVFSSEPHCDVPAYVCLPRNAEPPYAWFVCLQGHSTGMHNSIAVARSDDKHRIPVPGDRDFGLGCMARGVAAICIEQRSMGERSETVQKQVATHPCHDATMHSLMLGRTLVGERVWDVDRAIDYLMTRDDVDRRRIGVMGNSGGGTVSVFAAALLPRLTVAMPSCYFCTFHGGVMSIYHCMDNYVPGLMQTAECADVMGLFAPRPVVIVAGKDDRIFPIREVRKAFRVLKRIYEAAGAGDRCHLVVGPGGHRFYADLGWAKMLKELNRV